MYDRDFFMAVDDLMLYLLKQLVEAFGGTLIFIVLYLLLQPIRLYYYIQECIATERQIQREERIRFRNLKRNGHI